jgi:AcrR family transcriptional regulator
MSSTTAARTDLSGFDAPASVRVRRRRKDRPGELLDAALALFAERGFTATRAEEIAARAGVSKGTIYVYFPSKEDLLMALIARQLSSEIAAAAQRAAGHHGTSADRLRALLRDWCSLLDDEAAGALVKVVFTEARSFPQLMDFWVREVAEPVHRLIGHAVRDGMGRGEFRKTDPDVVVRTLVLPIIMGCLHRHAICASTDPLQCRAGYFEQHVEFVLQSLATCSCERT